MNPGSRDEQERETETERPGVGVREARGDQSLTARSDGRGCTMEVGNLANAYSTAMFGSVYGVLSTSS